MFYVVCAVALTVLALILVFVGVRPFFRNRWFLIWCKASLCMLVVLSALGVMLLAYDLAGYSVWSKGNTIATISTNRLGEQEFQVDVAVQGRDIQRFVIKGDLWQLDARVIAWPAWMSIVGISTGYRLDRISGRYLSLEDERTKVRTVFNVASGAQTMDAWRAAQSYDFLPTRMVNHGSGTYMPMTDGAIFEVHLGETSLLGRPVNKPAEQAVGAWR